ncbi:MAG: hypothetical protein CMH82_14235 [Nocardioides sp.]|nr:hypothetical protein [Nocardioides sp.]
MIAATRRGSSWIVTSARKPDGSRLATSMAVAGSTAPAARAQSSGPKDLRAIVATSGDGSSFAPAATRLRDWKLASKMTSVTPSRNARSSSGATEPRGAKEGERRGVRVDESGQLQDLDRQ